MAISFEDFEYFEVVSVEGLEEAYETNGGVLSRDGLHY